MGAHVRKYDRNLTLAVRYCTLGKVSLIHIPNLSGIGPTVPEIQLNEHF